MSERDIFVAIEKVIRENKEAVLVTIVDTDKSTPRKSGARMLVYPDGSIEGTIGGGGLEFRAIQDALELLKKGENKLIVYNIGDKGEAYPEEIKLPAACGGRVTVFFEVFTSDEEFFIVGAGHVGKRLAQLFHYFNWVYSVVDNREEYLEEKFFPSVHKLYHIDYSELSEKLPVNEKSWIIIMTHGHQFDALCLEEALKTKAKYIGMIGSGNKVITNFSKLMKKGIKIDNRVWAPIGLKLGNSEPAQVAFSIAAQILALKEGKREIIHFRDYFLKKFADHQVIKKLKEEGVWKDEGSKTES